MARLASAQFLQSANFTNHAEAWKEKLMSEKSNIKLPTTSKRGQYGQLTSQPSAGSAVRPGKEAYAAGPASGGSRQQAGKVGSAVPTPGSKRVGTKTNDCDEALGSAPKAQPVRDASPSAAGKVAKAEHLAARKQRG
jgi:hypothetical protein